MYNALDSRYYNTVRIDWESLNIIYPDYRYTQYIFNVFGIKCTVFPRIIPRGINKFKQPTDPGINRGRELFEARE